LKMLALLLQSLLLSQTKADQQYAKDHCLY
jgi:hypothetical protein